MADKSYGSIPERRTGHICSLCGFFGFQNEGTFDNLGSVGFDKNDPSAVSWVHYSCRTAWYRDEKNERRFEQVMDQIRGGGK